MPRPSILLLAGEASGDYHAAALVRNLTRRMPDLHIAGIGGDRLAAAGMTLLHHYQEINSIALSGGFELLSNVLTAYHTMKRELFSGRHQLFIPVDYPDVNILLCRVARNAGIPVCYYVSPQVWAWRRGRIAKLAKRVDHMMTLFPFEARLYEQAGLPANFVGHTLVGDVPEQGDQRNARTRLGLQPDQYTVALVPGSRQKEISTMLPRMAAAAKIFLHSFPDTQFVLPLAAEHLRPQVEEVLRQHGVDVAMDVSDATTVMLSADCGLVTSGTATLQAALVGLPHALVYVVDDWTWWLALRVLKPLAIMHPDTHLAIANVLAIEEEKVGPSPIALMGEQGYHIPCQDCGRPLFVPEVLQHQATPGNLADWLFRFREDPRLGETMKEGFRQTRRLLEPPANGPGTADIVEKMLRDSLGRG